MPRTTQPSTPRPRTPQRGFTLIELMVALAVAAILVATAVPAFSASTARARLEGAVNELGIDLQYARSEAIRRRTSATLTVNGTGTGYTLSYVDASTAPAAIVPFKTVALPATVSFTANTVVQFSSLRGLAPAQTLNATSSNTTSALRVLTNAVGRVQTCTPNGSFTGYATCL